MFDIAVIGDRDSIIGFSSLGLSIFTADNREEAVSALKKTVNGNFAVIYVTEYIASLCEDIIEKYKEEPLPAIILIPGVKGNTGNGMKNVSASVEKAVGSDILSN